MDGLTTSEWNAKVVALEAALVSGNWERIFAASVLVAAMIKSPGNRQERNFQAKRLADKVRDLGFTASLT